MVYYRASEGSGGYVVSILVNRQPLEERADGQVILPFETEYQIRLRNKTKNVCVAKIYIDEECVVPEGLIIKQHDYVDLDRPTTKPTKFKFVAVDSFDAIDGGKNQPNNPAMGVIRVEFYPEKEQPPVPVVIREYVPYYPGYPHFKPHWYRTNDLISCSSPRPTKGNEKLSCLGPETSEIADKIEAGATVEGGYSNQKFTSSYINVDWSNCVVLKVVLKGYWRDEVQNSVKSPLIAEKPRYCPNCNAKRKRPSAKYCEMCGSSFTY